MFELSPAGGRAVESTWSFTRDRIAWAVRNGYIVQDGTTLKVAG